MWDTLLINANLATMAAGDERSYGAIERAALAVEDGRIVWTGSENMLSGDTSALAHNVTDLRGAWVTPGLIDCHTHLVFGGNRASEFEARLNGASYEEIARAGGGILSTVTATRNASKRELYESAVGRLRAMQGEGVTTVEIKSGYGLDLSTEIAMLEVARELGEQDHLRVCATFLGAHALPPEFSNDRSGYIDLVCNEMIPEVARRGLVNSVDAFCETIGFSCDETRLVFEAAKAHGLPVKLHAEQLSDQGGSQLAASYDALSVDHLEYLSAEGIAQIAASNTVAVLLPGAFYFLRETKIPPIEELRAAGVPIAIASDCNPGSSPLVSPLLVLNMACTLFHLTPEQALTGMTRNAAKALGLDSEIGTLEVGKKADLAVWDVSDLAELSYWVGANPLKMLIVAGNTISL